MANTGIGNTMGALLVASAGMVCGWSGSASADVGCSYYRTKMPDFDQVRREQFPIFGLPGNGSMYCLPTSAENLLGYLHQAGWKKFLPNHGNEWYSPGEYVGVTIDLMFMGSAMSTDPEGGTGGSGGEVGMQSRLDVYYPDTFSCAFINPRSLTPEVCRQAMASGMLAGFCYGRYYFFQDSTYGFRWVRDGGHCVTLTGIENGCGATPTLTYRNPSSSDSDTAQSPFETAKFEIVKVNAAFAGSEDSQPKLVNRWKFNSNFEDGRLRVVDGMLLVCPISATVGGVHEGIFKRKPLVDINMGLSNPPQTTHALPQAMGGLEGIKTHPWFPAAVCVGGDGGLWLVNHNDGSATRLGLAGQGGGGCFGPDGSFYIQRSGFVERIDPLDLTEPSTTVATREHVLLARTTTNVGTHGNPREYMLVAVGRDSTGGLAILSAPVDDDGCRPFEPAPMPLGVNIPAGTGCQIAASPIDGSILILADGSRTATRCSRGPVGGAAWVVTETIALPEPAGPGEDPKNLQFDIKGRILYTHGGVVRVLERGAAGGWVPKNDSPWSGMVAGDFFELNQLRSSIVPWRGTRSDFNFDPSTEPSGQVRGDCIADFNNDGFVDGFDYDDFVRCFEGADGLSCVGINPASMMADVDGDGFVDGFDYDEFVRAFEAGC